MSAHTPGPWHALPSHTGRTFVYDVDGLVVALARSDAAPLIAAAPKLLDALRELVAVSDLNEDDTSVEALRAVVRAYAAINDALQGAPLP